jgi:hypothetical protein
MRHLKWTLPHQTTAGPELKIKCSIYSELEPGDAAVIKEIYDSENAQEIFAIELERALQVLVQFFPPSKFELSWVVLLLIFFHFAQTS